MMTPKMVAHFRRSVSFSNTGSPSPSSSTAKTVGKRIHFRSTSLPTRSHPIPFQLKFNLKQLKSQWASDTLPKSFNSGMVSDALVRLRTILESLDDLLDLSPSRDSLRHHPDFVEKVLEDFLVNVMVDVYGTFRFQISSLKHYNVATQLATRRKDGLKTVVCLKGLKKSGREIFKLMSPIQTIRGNPNEVSGSDSNPDPELVGVIKDVIQVIIMVLEAVFGGISGSFETQKTSWMMGLKNSKRGKGIKEVENGIWSLRNFKDEILNKKMMQEMEECIDGIESGSEKVFRIWVCMGRFGSVLIINRTKTKKIGFFKTQSIGFGS